MTKKIEGRPEAWETGELGQSEEHVRRSAAGLELEIEKSLAMKSISIRLPESLIEDFKMIADHNGIGYQTFMRKMLARIASAELKQMAIIYCKEAKAALKGGGEKKKKNSADHQSAA